jgi:1-acyl-sn-glycerol-3-phosphate acyltransferase
VEQSIQHFHRKEHLILTISPAGTRKCVIRWKTGFFHIACGAQVPIALGFLDYRRKVGGIGPLVYPTGNITADMQTIRNFYEGVTGKNPTQSMASKDIQHSN